MPLHQGGANLHFNSLKSKVVDQRIRQSLGGKEREIYFRLLKKMSPESVMLCIGVKFRESGAVRGLSVDNILIACHDARESTVNAQRKIGAGLDILTAVRDSGADPKMMYRTIFAHSPGIWKPIASEKAVLDWPGIKFIHSALGAGFVELDMISLKWLSGLPLKQMYASTEASVFITIQPDGEVRPETSITGAPSKNSAKRSVLMVAEVMMSFRSGRLGSSCFR